MDPAPAGAPRDSDAITHRTEVKFKVVFAKQIFEVSRALDSTVDELCKHLETITGVPSCTQKVMFKGWISLLKSADSFSGLLAGPGKPELLTKTIREAGITNVAIPV